MINLRPEDLPTQLETNRLILKKAQPSDADDLFKAARDSIDEVYPFLPWCHPNYEIHESRGWLETVQKDWESRSGFAFLIRDRDDGRVLGGCGLSRIDEHPVANMGYWVRTGATGRGVASEAARAVANFAFDELGLIRVEIIMSVNNPGSRRVAEKTGASREGTLRNRLRLHGTNHDAHIYSLIPPL